MYLVLHLVDEPMAEPIFASVNRVRPCYFGVPDTLWTGRKRRHCVTKKSTTADPVVQYLLDLLLDQDSRTVERWNSVGGTMPLYVYHNIIVCDVFVYCQDVVVEPLPGRGKCNNTPLITLLNAIHSSLIDVC